MIKKLINYFIVLSVANLAASSHNGNCRSYKRDQIVQHSPQTSRLRYNYTGHTLKQSLCRAQTGIASDINIKNLSCAVAVTLALFSCLPGTADARATKCIKGNFASNPRCLALTEPTLSMKCPSACTLDHMADFSCNNCDVRQFMTPRYNTSQCHEMINNVEKFDKRKFFDIQRQLIEERERLKQMSIGEPFAHYFYNLITGPSDKKRQDRISNLQDQMSGMAHIQQFANSEQYKWCKEEIAWERIPEDIRNTTTIVPQGPSYANTIISLSTLIVGAAFVASFGCEPKNEL